MKKNQMALIRRGDYSPRATLQLVRNRHGISVQCNIDKKRQFEAPNPRFCGAMAGGRSLATYEVLWRLYNKLPTDERKRVFISSTKDDGNQFLIMRNDDVIVATTDADGEFNAKVFVSEGSPFFTLLLELFEAIKIDNEKEPLWDARANPETPK